MKVSAPGPSLNTVTWIVEAADQLRGDGIFTSETVAYLRSIQQ